MHGGVKTSPGTAEERSYRRFISGTLEIMHKNTRFGIVPMNRSTKRKRLQSQDIPTIRPP